MKTPFIVRLIVLIGGMIGGLSGVAAQPPPWNPKGLAEADAPLRKLPAPDRQAIVMRLRIRERSLRASKVTTGSSHIYFVQGYDSNLCGATGNCEAWVLSDDYKVVLRGNAQTFKLLSTVHNGRADILTGLHDSAMASDLTRWRFNGSRYVRSSCALIEYEDLAAGRYKVPKITPRPCQN